MLQWVWVIENGAPALYERKGKCNRCGECCYKHTIRYQVRTVQVTEGDTDMEGPDDWSEWEGWSVFLAQGMWWWFKVRVVDLNEEKYCCPEYIREVKHCNLWGNDIRFKAICRYWPFHPDVLQYFPNCGWTLEKVAEGTTEEAYPKC